MGRKCSAGNFFPKKLPSYDAERVFPSDVAKVLVSKLEIVKPNDLDSALDVYPDYEKAAHALSELEKYLKVEMEKEKMEDYTEALKKAVFEVMVGMENEGK